MELPLCRLPHRSLSRINVVPEESGDGGFVIISHDRVGKAYRATLHRGASVQTGLSGSLGDVPGDSANRSSRHVDSRKSFGAVRGCLPSTRSGGLRGPFSSAFCDVFAGPCGEGRHSSCCERPQGIRRVRRPCSLSDRPHDPECLRTRAVLADLVD